jgi:hypothetical protein
LKKANDAEPIMWAILWQSVATVFCVSRRWLKSASAGFGPSA